jgi:hypothetical protein
MERSVTRNNNIHHILDKRRIKQVKLKIGDNYTMLQFIETLTKSACVTFMVLHFMDEENNGGTVNNFG